MILNMNLKCHLKNILDSVAVKWITGSENRLDLICFDKAYEFQLLKLRDFPPDHMCVTLVRTTQNITSLSR